MKSSTGVVVLLALLVLVCYPHISLADPPQDMELGSFVVRMSVDSSNRIQLLPAPYLAQPGDLILFDNHSRFIATMYRLVGTSQPTHAAIVVRRLDGSMGLLEAGPNLIPDLIDKVFIFAPVPRLQVTTAPFRAPLENAAYRGTIGVLDAICPGPGRQRLLLATIGHAGNADKAARRRIRKRLLGKTCLDRHRWTCSELTTAAATAAGILDRRIHFANAMYPRDFAYDENFDLSPFYHPLELWYPRPELQWVGNGVETGYRGPRRPLPR